MLKFTAQSRAVPRLPLALQCCVCLGVQQRAALGTVATVLLYCTCAVPTADPTAVPLPAPTVVLCWSHGKHWSEDCPPPSPSLPLVL